MQDSIESTFLKLIKTGVSEGKTDVEIIVLTPGNYKFLINLARKNHVCSLIYFAIGNIEKTRPLSETEILIRDAISKEYYRDIFLDVQQKHYLNIIKEAFEQCKYPLCVCERRRVKK